MAQKSESSQKNLFEDLIQLRDQYRQRAQDAVVVIKAKDVQFEKNRLGHIGWYLHPSLTNTAIRTMMTYVQEIPPGGRSGRLHFQGGAGHLRMGRERPYDARRRAAWSGSRATR